MRKKSTVKLLMASILAIFTYDTEIRVFAKLTHVGANGEEIDQLKGCKLAKPMTISFRIKDEADRDGNLLPAKEFFNRLQQRYTGLLKPNEEITFTVGSTIYLCAADVHDWDGQTLFRGHAVHRLAGFEQDSVSGHVKSRKVVFEYAQPSKRRNRRRGKVKAMEAGALDAPMAAEVITDAELQDSFTEAVARQDSIDYLLDTEDHVQLEPIDLTPEPTEVLA